MGTVDVDFQFVAASFTNRELMEISLTVIILPVVKRIERDIL